ncbi:hypothetical protein Mapa_010187 [Marchantia paleacea]|nr:hypothetical protein Mapa_010187 [Marchantia paleacea]
MVGPLGSLITRYLSCVLRNIAGGLGSGRCVWKRRVHSTGFMNNIFRVRKLSKNSAVSSQSLWICELRVLSERRSDLSHIVVESTFVVRLIDCSFASR